VGTRDRKHQAILYSQGRWGGRALVLRHGGKLRVSAGDLDRAEGWFARYGDAVVLGARVVPFARSVVSIPAGTSRMPPVRFAVLTALGSAAWNAVLIGAGYALGANWDRVSGWLGAYSDVVLVVVAILIAGRAHPRSPAVACCGALGGDEFTHFGGDFGCEEFDRRRIVRHQDESGYAVFERDSCELFGPLL
jgi:hypothetical protein